MTFEEQVKRAKEEKIKYRIHRDIAFIILGIIFLSISFIIGFSNNKETKVNNSNNITIKES